MRFNFNSGYGQILVNQIAASVGPIFGKIFVVVGASDVGFKEDMMKEIFVPDPDGKVRFYATLKAAYDAATSNADDIILLSGHSSHVVANGIAWTKNRIHVIGMDGGHRLVQQGAKIVSTVGAADAYVLKVTGNRNSFENLKIIQNDTNAAALHVVEMGGEGTVWKNCSFIFGVADNLDQTNAYEVVCGEDSGTFINCLFGSDVLDSSVARAVMAIDIVTTSQEMKSCIFKDCIWNIASDDANANFIRVLANTDLKFGQIFINPIFMCTLNQTFGAIALTDAVDSVSGLVEGNMLFVNPASNCTNFASALTANISVVGPGVATQAAFIGVGVTPS